MLSFMGAGWGGVLQPFTFSIAQKQMPRKDSNWVQEVRGRVQVYPFPRMQGEWSP